MLGPLAENLLKSTRTIFRDLSGVLLLDKPQGISSNAALQKVRRLFLASKGGHTGSLDPLASGLLPICLGEATKFSSHLLGSDKGYSVRVRFGSETDTLDAEGVITRRCEVPEFSSEEIERALDSFRGEISQIPPMYSALKHQGKRLYDLARQGVDIERAARPVRIERLVLVSRGSGYLDLDVVCSKGTYIRSLAQDIGRHLHCAAHVELLRRTAVAHHEVGEALTLESLEQLDPERRLEVLLPIDALVRHFPRVQLDEEMTRLASHGHPVQISDLLPQGWVRIYGVSGFMGLGEVVSAGRVHPRRMARLMAESQHASTSFDQDPVSPLQ